MANRPAPHAHPGVHNIERLSPGKRDATVAKMNGGAMLWNSDLLCLVNKKDTEITVVDLYSHYQEPIV